MLWTDQQMYTTNNLFNTQSSSPNAQYMSSSYNTGNSFDILQSSVDYNSNSHANMNHVGANTTTEKTSPKKENKASNLSLLKRKHRHGSTSSKEEDGENDNENTKRKNFLERNRQAALKCRQRKKQWLNNLQERVEFLVNDNEQLQLQANVMRDEVVSLRNLLLTHKDCHINGGSNKMITQVSLVGVSNPLRDYYQPVSSTLHSHQALYTNTNSNNFIQKSS